ncbi:hypothetical protein L2E82_29593 [Cichorium intybus]|uniref:Uncharacterized protein n=1 Tax=Cichorium intybus TaxID=13427 RepID=A0ACB9CXZ4_CICIN|nr:hypothetical protein L2E82_29593 [Cichorium intybus]
MDRRVESEIQMYYEFGVFSTIYGGEEMPYWITDRSNGSSIAFTVPSSPKNLTGLNFCSVRTSQSLNVVLHKLPVIIICNITKNLTWIYHHYSDNIYEGCLTFLSHWMFGMNEMECGDQVTITTREFPYDIYGAVTKECGVSFVYNDGDTDEEEDALGYYKSWNQIIGGDLAAFQSTTGEYSLSKQRILFSSLDIDALYYDCFCGDGARFKDELKFRAFSRRTSCILEDGP